MPRILEEAIRDGVLAYRVAGGIWYPYSPAELTEKLSAAEDALKQALGELKESERENADLSAQVDELKWLATSAESK
jgi:hypothetical protein